MAALTFEEVVNGVIAGDYGTGNERQNKVQEAGYNYFEVQAFVNDVMTDGAVTEKITHTVMDGDTIEGIAKMYGVTVDMICGWNYKEHETILPDYIEPGWDLEIVMVK